MISLLVFTPDFLTYHEVSYSSLQTKEMYNGIGTISLTVAATAENIKNLQKDCFLYFPKTKQAFWIRRISPSSADNTITINGYTTNALLNKRITLDFSPWDGFIGMASKDYEQLTDANGNILVSKGVENAVEGQLYDLVVKNLRELQNVNTGLYNSLTEALPLAFERGQLLDEIIKALELTSYGQRMFFDYKNKKHIFEIYQGKDLTVGSKAVRFSEEQGTAKNLIIDLDDSVFKNVCYVKGKKIDDTEIIVTVGEDDGEDTFEIWHDTEFTQDREETDEAFIERLQTEGKKVLAERAKVMNFNVEIDTSEYGTAYNLGDLVTCVSRRFGVKFNSRISEVWVTQDPNIKTVSLVLGNPTIDLIKEMKLWQK